VELSGPDYSQLPRSNKPVVRWQGPEFNKSRNEYIWQVRVGPRSCAVSETTLRHLHGDPYLEKGLAQYLVPARVGRLIPSTHQRPGEGLKDSSLWALPPV